MQMCETVKVYPFNVTVNMKLLEIIYFLIIFICKKVERHLHYINNKFLIFYASFNLKYSLNKLLKKIDKTIAFCVGIKCMNHVSSCVLSFIYY